MKARHIILCVICIIAVAMQGNRIKIANKKSVRL